MPSSKTATFISERSLVSTASEEDCISASVEAHNCNSPLTRYENLFY